MTREDADAQTRPLCPVRGGPVTLAEGGTVKAMGDLGDGPGVVVVIRPRYRSQARCTCSWVGKTRLLSSAFSLDPPMWGVVGVRSLWLLFLGSVGVGYRLV